MEMKNMTGAISFPNRARWYIFVYIGLKPRHRFFNLLQVPVPNKEP